MVTSPAHNALREHRRHKSDGYVLQRVQEGMPKAQVSLMKKRPNHKRGSSLDMPLESIPENLKCRMGVVAAGLFLGTCAISCDKSFESFVIREKNVLRNKHRRIKSDGSFFRGGRRLQQLQKSVHVTF